MIGLLHGYLLEGSGSNLWTRAIARSLCRRGEPLHLVCQENHPERYDFISRALSYGKDGSVETVLRRETPYPAPCTLHKPSLGATLPVYVWDQYEEFERVVPMTELSDAEIEAYLERNVEVVTRVVREHAVTVLHANHAVLMSVVAERVSQAAGVPFTVMPHGSAIEYAVKKDERFLRYASGALSEAARVFVIGREMRQRVVSVFGQTLPAVAEKLVELNLGVDTELFEPASRRDRAARIGTLKRALAYSPRGKGPAQSERLGELLPGCSTREELLAALWLSSEYDHKLPDRDLEARLDRIDWTSAPVILFVGRLIASKGLHSVLAALPPILEHVPNARLLVVGHGPLREPMEALLWALRSGDRELAENIVAWGSSLEGPGERPLEEVRAYWDTLAESGALDGYFELARALLGEDSVVFTGYLTHTELRHLFPCCDAAVFPSVVAEAGPLVFLEALASGCFPLGTYFAGMAASIDSLASELPDAAEAMKLSPEPGQTVAEIAAKVPRALALGASYGKQLRRVAVERYDWRSVSGRFAATLKTVAESEAA
ncbi:MAG: glycosyltransferase family 4 protein [Longimicrobiaceae bacterium]